METDARFLRQLSLKTTSYLFSPGQYIVLSGTSVMYTLVFQTLIPNHLDFRGLHRLRRRHGSGDVLCQKGSGSGHWRWWNHCGRHFGSWGLLWRGKKWFYSLVAFIPTTVASRSCPELPCFLSFFLHLHICLAVKSSYSGLTHKLQLSSMFLVGIAVVRQVRS